MLLADTLRELLVQPTFLDHHRLQVTPGIGIVLVPDHGSTSADLLKRADLALYRAKDSGRNVAHLFYDSMQKAASDRLRMENDLRLALTRGEFSLYYQPQVDSRRNRIIGAIVAMAQNLNLTVIAEGVEKPLQLEFLEQLGCTLYQGYLFSAPLTFNAFEDHLRLPGSVLKGRQLNLLE